MFLTRDTASGLDGRAGWAPKRRSLPTGPGSRYYGCVALFEPIFTALNDNHVRYVVVGGLATVLHGFARLTADIDLIVDLAPDEARRAVTTLVGLGFRPRVPVDVLDYADPEIRRRWIDEKGMRVLSLWDPAQPMREIDLFVDLPIISHFCGRTQKSSTSGARSCASLRFPTS